MGRVDQNHRVPRTDGQSVRGQGEQQPHRSDTVQQDLDLDLVRQLLARDESAWNQFVMTYQRLIISRINAAAAELNITAPDAHITDEIRAEVFSQLLSNEMDSLRQFSGRSRLSTWLTVVARRTALRYFARSVRRPRQPDTAELDCLPDITPATSGNPTSRQQQVDRAMPLLSADDRQLMHMFYHQQLSYDQIARTLRISINTVGPKLDRARRRLRTVLERQAADRELLDE